MDTLKIISELTAVIELLQKEYNQNDAPGLVTSIVKLANIRDEIRQYHEEKQTRHDKKADVSMYEQLAPWQRELVNLVVRDLEREVVEGIEDLEDFEDEATEIVSKAVLACVAFCEKGKESNEQANKL